MAHANPESNPGLSPEINWKRLADSVAYYQEHHFKYIQVPWTASAEAMRTTFPKFEFIKEHWWDLVGSSEQSFIDMSLKNELPSGSYVALTPCFRYEEVLDELHQPYFMKTELFCSVDASEKNLKTIIDTCFNWFKDITPAGSKLEKVATEEGTDIFLNGVEIGSYGRRAYKDIEWIYATGHAEPRFSVALRR